MRNQFIFIQNFVNFKHQCIKKNDIATTSYVQSIRSITSFMEMLEDDLVSQQGTNGLRSKQFDIT